MTRPSRTARTLVALALFVSLAALLGAAFAQATGGDPVSEGGINAILVALVGGAVAWLRETPLFEKIDGPVTVPLFALVTGGVVGAGGDLLGLLQPDVTAVLGEGWAGAAAGLIAGVEAVFGVSLVRYFAKVVRRDDSGQLRVSPSEALAAGRDVLAGDAAPGPVQTAVGFVLDVAQRILGQTPGGGALAAIYPLLVKYAQAPEVLTDDVRARIQSEVLLALKRAGLVGQDLE